MAFKIHNEKLIIARKTIYPTIIKSKVLKVSSKGFDNIDETFNIEKSKSSLLMNSYFISIFDTKENYNKMDTMHNLLNNLKLTSI